MAGQAGRRFLQEIFATHVMCDYTPRAPRRLPKSLWVHQKQLYDKLQPHAPVEMLELGPDGLKQLITVWYKDHPAFAGLAFGEWCKRLKDNSPGRAGSHTFKFPFEHTPGTGLTAAAAFPFVSCTLTARPCNRAAAARITAAAAVAPPSLPTATEILAADSAESWASKPNATDHTDLSRAAVAASGLISMMSDDGVKCGDTHCPYEAQLRRNDTNPYLGHHLATAERAALACARTPLKRAAPLPEPPPAKQPRPATSPPPAAVFWSQPGSLAWSLEPSTASFSPASLCPPPHQHAARTPKRAALGPPAPAATVDGHISFGSLLDTVKWELNIAAATPADATIAQANAMMGSARPSGTLRQQLDRLIAETTCAY